jgi:hypothetical protein
MNDYILLMHDDAPRGADVGSETAWAEYIGWLRRTGKFAGGSSIGGGACFAKAGTAVPITPHLTGFIRVEAESIDAARSLLAGNPVFEAGGTVEIRELLRDG